jgi:hypothetical protein
MPNGNPKEIPIVMSTTPRVGTLQPKHPKYLNLCAETQTWVISILNCVLQRMSARELSGVKDHLSPGKQHPLTYPETSNIPHGCLLAKALFRSLTGVCDTEDNRTEIGAFFMEQTDNQQYQLAPAKVVLSDWSCLSECVFCASREKSALPHVDEGDFYVIHRKLARVTEKRKLVEDGLRHATPKMCNARQEDGKSKTSESMSTSAIPGMSIPFIAGSEDTYDPPASPSYSPTSPKVDDGEVEYHDADQPSTSTAVGHYPAKRIRRALTFKSPKKPPTSTFEKIIIARAPDKSRPVKMKLDDLDVILDVMETDYIDPCDQEY